MLTIASGTGWAIEPINTITTSTQAATADNYTGSTDGNAYTWGVGNDLYIETITGATNGITYNYQIIADNVVIRRVDNALVTGNRCSIFAEKTAVDSIYSYNPTYPEDGLQDGNCDMASIMGGRIINRGTLDVFSNSANNIERVDFIFSTGIPAPSDPVSLASTGHVVIEKGGNNSVSIAAILALDENGDPSEYGPLVTVIGSDYGATNYDAPFGFLQNQAAFPQTYPERTGASGTTENLGMALVTLTDMQVPAGATYFGFSYFPEDVSNGDDLLNYQAFATDTNINGDAADLFGGSAGYFVSEELPVVSGTLFRDVNGNGTLEDGEAGIGGVSISLYADSNNNGTWDPVDQLIGASGETSPNGDYTFTAPGVGPHFVVVDDADADFPAGYVLANGFDPLAVNLTTGTLNRDIPASSNGSVISGTIFLDDNNDGAQNGSESGLSGVSITLFEDSNGNGVYDPGVDQQIDTGVTGTDGSYSLAGLEDGTYFLQPGPGGLPADSSLADGNNPATITINGGNVSRDIPVVDSGTNPVDPVEDQPTANPDNVTVPQNNPTVIDVLENDNNPNGSALIVTIIEAPANGIVTIADGIVTYTPTEGYTGPDEFVYQIQDPDGNTDTATVSINVEVDSDGDGIADVTDLDDDNDGILDSIEGTGDFDNDGIPNRLDLESDGDGIPDLLESGLNFNELAVLDTDRDSRIDSNQAFGSNGLADAVETTPGSGQPDYNNDGTGDLPADTDRDNAFDFLDLDSDNDGVPDNIEAGGTAVLDSSDLPDSDGDGIPDFRECDCESLGLITGVDGHGAGSTGWFWLMLPAASWMRRKVGRLNSARIHTSG